MTEFEAARREERSQGVRGLLPPIPTPFLDGKVDFDGLDRILEYLGDHVHGVLLGGSVGELPSLSLDERLALIRHLGAYRNSGKSLAVSIADNSIDHSRRLAEAATEAGADYLMVSCPSYFMNTGPMLEEYFGHLSGFADVDLCLYDNPAASHTTLSLGDVERIRRAAPRMTAIKVTDTSLGKVAAVKDATTLTVFSGEDAVLWNQLSDGADGAMVALPLIYAAETWQM